MIQSYESISVCVECYNTEVNINVHTIVIELPCRCYFTLNIPFLDVGRGKLKTMDFVFAIRCVQSFWELSAGCYGCHLTKKLTW